MSVVQPRLMLYYAPGSSSMATHIALVESGLSFTTRLVSLKRGEQRSADFLAINPEGKVPVLRVGEVSLTEVAATLYFIARQAPQSRLWPEDDVLAQAQVISWMSFNASALHPARYQGDEEILRVFELAERRLDGRPWAVGKYSIADIHLFRLFLRMRRSLAPSLARFPDLETHFQRMLARPAVQQVIAAESQSGHSFPI